MATLGDTAVVDTASSECVSVRDCDGATDETCAPDGLPDPGGLSWICGVAAPEMAWTLLLAAFLFVSARRRRANSGLLDSLKPEA